jgi:hypothetical protein
MMFMEYREENAKDTEREVMGTAEQHLSSVGGEWTLPIPRGLI